MYENPPIFGDPDQNLEWAASLDLKFVIIWSILKHSTRISLSVKSDLLPRSAFEGLDNT